MAKEDRIGNGKFVGGIILTIIAVFFCFFCVILFKGSFETIIEKKENAGEAVGSVFGAIILLPLFLLAGVGEFIFSVIGLILSGKYESDNPKSIRGIVLIILNSLLIILPIVLFIVLVTL